MSIRPDMINDSVHNTAQIQIKAVNLTVRNG